MAVSQSIYQIKVTLNGSKPPIWRRVLVPENITLSKLHSVIQIAMGWYDCHLHLFQINQQSYGYPADDDYLDTRKKSETRYRLNKLINTKGQIFTYEYDFGDGWLHTILLEKILPIEEGHSYPVCIKGKGACPPEDVGGIWRYQISLEAMADPDHEEHANFLEWYGENFDPEAFSLEEVNTGLLRMK